MKQKRTYPFLFGFEIFPIFDSPLFTLIDFYQIHKSFTKNISEIIITNILKVFFATISRASFLSLNINFDFHNNYFVKEFLLAKSIQCEVCVRNTGCNFRLFIYFLDKNNEISKAWISFDTISPLLLSIKFCKPPFEYVVWKKDRIRILNNNGKLWIDSWQIPVEAIETKFSSKSMQKDYWKKPILFHYFSAFLKVLKWNASLDKSLSKSKDKKHCFCITLKLKAIVDICMWNTSISCHFIFRQLDNFLSFCTDCCHPPLVSIVCILPSEKVKKGSRWDTTTFELTRNY